MIQKKLLLYFPIIVLLTTIVAMVCVLVFVSGKYGMVQPVSGQTCSFVQANCQWDALSGATSYNITITDTNSNTIIKQDTVQSPITSYVFPITQGDTYRCDVSAVNSCGASGTAGTATALCAQNGLVASTTPTPTSAVALAACGGTCQTSADCQSGYTCITANNGTGYCGLASLQSQCALNPSSTTCCIAPTATPAPPVTPLPPTGTTQNTIAALGGILTTIVLGVFLIWRSTL